MQEFEGKVAVISGGGGVLGLALGRRFANAGMKIVLADLDTDSLAESEATLRDAGATVLGVQTDVSQSASVQQLADRAVEAFGGVHVLCNNVGINTRDESLWTATEADWQWALGANLWGTIHAIRIFVPIMLAQDTEGHIVNTASTAGLAGRPGTGSYVVTKTAVIALSEVLFHELARIDAKVHASVLLPHIRGAVTKSVRPPAYRESSDPADLEREREHYEERLRVASSRVDFKTPDEIADDVFEGIREERFYIITRPDIAGAIVTARAEAIVDGDDPTTAGMDYQSRLHTQETT